MDIPEAWSRWQFRDRCLISPDGEKITPERLSGLLWRDQMELRLAGYASRRQAEAGRLRAAAGPRVKVVIVELAELRARGVLAG